MTSDYDLSEMQALNLHIQSISHHFQSYFQLSGIDQQNPPSNPQHTRKQIPNLKKKKFWSEEERIKFIQFYVIEFLYRFEEGSMEWNSKRKDEFFFRMAKYIGSRSRDQCRSHNQHLATKEKRSLLQYLRGELEKWKSRDNLCWNLLQKVTQAQKFKKRQQQEITEQMKELDQIYQLCDFDRPQ